MKKPGFTLAEVLITLGIIGVVAALTTPALVQNIGNAEVGPKLQKTKTTVEAAIEMMLTENNAKSVTALLGNNPSDFGRILSRYMKITKNDTSITYREYPGKEIFSYTFPSHDFKRYDTSDGITIYLPIPEKHKVADGYANIPNNQYIGLVYVDINGNEGPNRRAKDFFTFVLYNDGTMRPYGSQEFWRTSFNYSYVSSNRWNNNHNCDQNGIKNASTCAGSIFENGMKIIYQ